MFAHLLLFVALGFLLLQRSHLFMAENMAAMKPPPKKGETDPALLVASLKIREQITR